MSRIHITVALVAGAALFARGGSLPAQVTERVSVDSAGNQADAYSEVACLSFDGRFVLFQSTATNLVVGDTNGFEDIFVFDRLTRTTERVNLTSAGEQTANDLSRIDSASCVSADGRYVSFYSFATNLIPGGDPNGWAEDVFVRDRWTGTTELIDVGPTGVAASTGAWGGGMSADGRYVTFTSAASDLLPGGTNGTQHIWVRDRKLGTNEIVSVNSDGEEGDDACYMGQFISADGRFVCFGSQATNLVPGTVPGIHVYVHDRETGTTELIDVHPDGGSDPYASNPGPLSADGRFVTFTSESTELVPLPDANGHGQDIFLRDRRTGITERVNVDSNGAQGNNGGEFQSISADGRFVAFSSWSTNLVAGDTNGKQDAFVHDRLTGRTTRWSVDSNGHESIGDQFYAGNLTAISGDGRVVAFTGWADDLVDDDTNGFRDVFVRAPWLSLEASPAAPDVGATVTVTEWRGEPARLTVLALVEADGTPLFLPVAIDLFDANGIWTLADVVPAGLSGSVWTIQAVGFVPTGRVQATNPVTLSFQ